MLPTNFFTLWADINETYKEDSEDVHFYVPETFHFYATVNSIKKRGNNAKS